MNKRLISLLLVVVMICTLLPMTVLAEETASNNAQESENITSTNDFIQAILKVLNPDVETALISVDEELPKDKGVIAVPVYGKELTSIITSGDLFTQSEEAIKVRLSGKNVIPEVKITVTGIGENAGYSEVLSRADYSTFNGVTPDVDVTLDLDTFVQAVTKATYAYLKLFTGFGYDELKENKLIGKFVPSEEKVAALVNLEDSDLLLYLGTGKLPDKYQQVLDMFNPMIKGIDKILKGLHITDFDIGNETEESEAVDADEEDSRVIVRILNAFGYKQFKQLAKNLIDQKGLGLTEAECADLSTFCNALFEHYGKEGAQAFISQNLGLLAKTHLQKYAGSAYHMYASEELKEGEYYVSVESIGRQGFAKNEKEIREYKVSVGDGKVTFVGEENTIGTDMNGQTLSSFLFGDTPKMPEPIETNDIEILEAINGVIELGGTIEQTARKALDAVQKLFNGGIQLPLLGENDGFIPYPLHVKFSLTFKGLWLNREDPFIGFANEDLGGNPIKKTVADEKAQFVMVDRDELINVMEAMIGVGKDVFTNTVNGLKEVYKNENPNDNLPTWDEFTALHKDVLSLDTTGETPQVQFDAKSLLKVVWIYVKMMDVPSVWDNFLAKDVRLPAILMATPDDNGVVKVSEDSNVTLVWMLDALINIADVSQEALADIGEQLRENGAIEDVVGAVFEGAELDNPELKQLLINVLTWVAENTAEGSKTVVEILKATAEPVKGVINEWIYPLLQNDALFHLVGQFLEVKDGSGKMHGILTDKMPDSYYLLLQKKAPESYLINPMVYTVKLDWAEDGWVYAKIANLGIILPYFAEDYYTFLRNNSIAKTSDAILNRISNGKYETLIQDIISGKLNATEQVVTASATGIAFQSWIMYNFMGGRLVYKGEDGQTALQNDLVKWIKAKGNTAQNLLGFGNEIYQRSKAVVTADLTLTENKDPEDMWAFYNASKSIKENIVAQATAIMKGISGSIVTDGSKVNGAVKDAIDKVIEGAAKIDTTSKLAAAVDQARQKVTETVTKVATSLITTAIKKTASLFSSLFKSLRK